MDAGFPTGASFLSAIAVVVPAWQPDDRLPQLIDELAAMGDFFFVVVDDGSDAAHQAAFAAFETRPRVRLIRHAKNFGKGHALKTAWKTILSELPHVEAVVTADADGQHRPADILRVAQRLVASGNRVVLGCRTFSSAMPFRSRAGNFFTRMLFNLLVGLRIRDTQTGLRGFPKKMLPELVQIHGERYEYEMAVLAHVCHKGPLPIEVAIETVYEKGNRSSHFEPVRDSVRVYLALARACIETFRNRSRD